MFVDVASKIVQKKSKTPIDPFIPKPREEAINTRTTILGAWLPR